MSEATRPPSDRAPGGAAAPGRLALAIMATVLTFALIIAVDGMLSLLTDRDVITEPGAGPLVAIAMVGVPVALVFTLCFRRRPVNLAARVIVAGLGSIILAPLAGAVFYAIVRAEPATAIVFFGRYVLDQFVIATAVIAAAVVLSHALVPVRA